MAMAASPITSAAVPVSVYTHCPSAFAKRHNKGIWGEPTRGFDPQCVNLESVIWADVIWVDVIWVDVGGFRRWNLRREGICEPIKEV